MVEESPRQADLETSGDDDDDGGGGGDDDDDNDDEGSSILALLIWHVLKSRSFAPCGRNNYVSGLQLCIHSRQ